MTATANATNTAAEEIEEGEDCEEEDELSTLCPYCNAHPPVYTCPRCYARSCSVACCKRHKLFRQCNGVRDPTAFVKRSRLMADCGVLNRDYAFLAGVEKSIVSSAAATKEEEMVGGGDDGKKGFRMTKPHIQKLLKRRNTILKFAPWAGFQRAKENETRAVAKKHKGAHVEWTVEWLIIDSSHPQQKILNHHISEKQTVLESFFGSPRGAPFSSATAATTAIEVAEPDKAEEPEKKTPKRIKANTNFYLVLEAPANKRRCVKLDPHKPWTENLRERTVVEFPQVLVVAPAHQGGGAVTQTPPEGWEVMADTRKIVELKTDDQAPKEGDSVGELVETSKRPAASDDISSTLAAIKRARTAR